MGTEGRPLGWFPSASRQISPEPIMLMGFWGGGGPKMWLKGLRMQRDLDRARGPLVHSLPPVFLRGVSAFPSRPLPARPSAQTQLVHLWVLVSQGSRQVGGVSGIPAPQQSPGSHGGVGARTAPL